MVASSPLEWYSTTFEALMNLWGGFLGFIPEIVGALVVFLIGWVVASVIGRVITQVLNRIKFNNFFARLGWGEAFKRADLEVDLSEFIGAIIKWILVFVFLLAAVEILGFSQFAVFLTGILGFIPSVIVSVLIFVVAVISADILQKITVASMERARVGYSKLAGLLVRWAILVFAFLAILVQLGIARQLIVTLFTGIVALIVISFGLAFGLGGKDIAAEILRDLRNRLR